MKNKLLAALAALALVLPTYRLAAADTNTVASQLKELVTEVQGKIKEGKKTEADLSDELKKFDQILEKHKGQKTDEVAQVLVMKAMLYVQIIEDYDKGTALLKQVKQDFPGTKPAENVDKILDSLEKQKGSKKIRAALVDGAKFPDFEEKDMEGKPISIAAYKGKVVLLDFWATWCGPCVRELPNVLAAYEKHHPKGFEIIGISLDQDEKKLKDFLAEKKMTWRQIYDGKGWQSKLAGKYGVNSIPATYLLDGEGKIIGKDLRGEALEEAVAKALKAK